MQFLFVLTSAVQRLWTASSRRSVFILFLLLLLSFKFWETFLFPDQHLVLTGTSVLGSLHFHGPVTGQMGTGFRQSGSWISLKCPWKCFPGHSEEWTVRMKNVRRYISVGCVPEKYEMHNLASACILKTRGGAPSLES